MNDRSGRKGRRGRGKLTCFYKSLNSFPIVARPRNNGYKFCFFLCSSPSLPSYLNYFAEGAVVLERAVGWNGVASSRLNFLACPRSEPNVGDVNAGNSDFHTWKRNDLKRSSCGKVMENGILDAIMESEKGPRDPRMIQK